MGYRLRLYLTSAVCIERYGVGIDYSVCRNYDIVCNSACFYGNYAACLVVGVTIFKEIISYHNCYIAGQTITIYSTEFVGIYRAVFCLSIAGAADICAIERYRVSVYRPPCIQRYVANSACLNYRHLIAASLGIVPTVETVSFTGRRKQCYVIAFNRERRYSAVCIRAAVEYIAYRVFNGIPLCRELDICRNCRIEVVSDISYIPACECIAVLSRSLGRRDFFAVVYGYVIHRTAVIRIEAYGIGLDYSACRNFDIARNSACFYGNYSARLVVGVTIFKGYTVYYNCYIVWQSISINRTQIIGIF